MVDRVDKQKVIEYDDDKGITQNTNEWVIYTSGIDLDKIKTNKYIDFDSVYINDIYMAYINYGIEAARNLIVIESNRLYGGSGNALNITHIALLADIMTNTGNITSIDRHGINRLDTDPLSRASFEQPIEQLIMASAFNEVDNMRSVSSRIMAGRCFKGGTGLCDILMDNELIENSEYNNQLNEILNLKKDQLEINTAIESFNKIESNNDDIFIP
jgi:DNA-directed RNA polymerase II subunit RPB1